MTDHYLALLAVTAHQGVRQALNEGDLTTLRRTGQNCEGFGLKRYIKIGDSRPVKANSNLACLFRQSGKQLDFVIRLD
jgi:hypothetical protein